MPSERMVRWKPVSHQADKKLRFHILLQVDFEDPVILVTEKLMGSFPQKFIEDSSPAVLHVFLEYGKVQKKVSKSALHQLL